MAITNTEIVGSPTLPAAIYTSSGNNAITTIIVCNKVLFDPANPLTGQTSLYLWAMPAADGSTPLDKHLIVNFCCLWNLQVFEAFFSSNQRKAFVIDLLKIAIGWCNIWAF